MERNLQQQVLSWILTKFPFHPAGCANHWGTFTSAKVVKKMVKQKERAEISCSFFLYTYVYIII